MSDEHTICVDTFENDDVSGCYTQTTTTTEPCTTGVINELGGCEPVGVIPVDLQPIGAINGPATVDIETSTTLDDIPMDSDLVYVTPTVEAVTVYVPPSQLPATGAESTLAFAGLIVLLAGVGLLRLARNPKGSTSRRGS